VELAKHLGFDAESRRARAAQHGLNEASQELTDLLHARVVGPAQEELHRAFFGATQQQTSFAKVAGAAEVASRLRRHQRHYVATLGHDLLSHGYFESRLEVGAVHRRIGTPLPDYVAVALALERALVSAVEEQLEAEPELSKRLVDHVLAISGLDLSLAMEAYHRLTLEDLETHLARARDDHEQLQTVTRRDSLTGTSTREFMLHTLDHALHEARTMHLALSVAMLDLDHFKRVNDTHGHLVGDAVLRSVAARMREALRDDDLVGRYGGEEFLLILRGAPLATATSVSDRLRKRISAEPVEHDGLHVHVTASIGIAQLGPGEDAPALIGRADQALYRAQNMGRDFVAIDTVPSQH